MQESQGHLLSAERVTTIRPVVSVDISRELSKPFLNNLCPQWLVLIRTKDLREVVGRNATEEEVGVGDSQRAAFAVTCRSRMGPS